ncbi:MAG: thiamine pyrophosphate-binding protein [Acidimicrobiia bacterium]|nr:thiamine pyrophosphate-binding protein [Acidimicrobiia bacterium]MXZ84585.1 thiamine pyrophosphate-binding protein [Acidimicrobiia bacterium]MYE74644.1 thiamine pyrophosphate-binding protein [Acidimicrobiia bacterium]MYG71615.1 thiamine pyrophosphate-binding protein [Acidimicrobiia bacterium]MYJ62169.1 thiamine pyrophosphate-binding protein [Acidimicrobiia bacterium]
MTTQSDAVSTRSGGSAVVEQLVREGVEVVFGIPGVQLMHILDSFHRGADKIRYITVRHEQATAFMADGYARVSGRPGTTLIVPGPGVYNAGSGLATAYAASSPVFQISGQINRDAIGQGNSLPHEVHDQLDVVRPITKYAERITEADQLPGAVRRAFAAMTSGRPRPAHLEIPPETMGEPTSAPVVDPVAPEPTRPDPELVAQAARLLAEADHPLMVVGGGAHGAAPVLRELQHHLQAATISTREGKGVIDGRDPAAIGTLFVHQRLAPIIADADVVLAVGTRLQGVGLGDSHRLIHLDVDPSEIGRFTPPEIPLVGDAEAGAADLLDALRQISDPNPDRSGQWREARQRVDAAHRAAGPQAAIVEALADSLPANAILAVDATMVGYMCHMYLPVAHPRSYLTSSYMGTLGFAMNMALGAKVAAPERPVVSINGDGGFLFASNELATAVQYDIPTVHIVVNDSGYGNTRLDQELNYGGRLLGTELRNPDLVKYAESFGCAATRVVDNDGLRSAVREMIAEDRPAVVELVIDPLPTNGF